LMKPVPVFLEVAVASRFARTTSFRFGSEPFQQQGAFLKKRSDE